MHQRAQGQCWQIPPCLADFRLATLILRIVGRSGDLPPGESVNPGQMASIEIQAISGANL